MDIKSLIDSEDGPASRKPSIPVSAKQEYLNTQAIAPHPQVSPYDNRRDIRPPQPSPLQTPAPNGQRYQSISSQDSTHSPYQRTPSFEFRKGQPPPVQVPIQGTHSVHQASQQSPQDGNPATGVPSGRSIGQNTPLSQTPTTSTPGSASAYSNFPRPTSSHSIPTPNSTQHSASFLRESPQPSYTQPRNFAPVQGGQQYVSQPGTPLGPPSTYGRPNLNHQRESPGVYDHRRSHSGGPQDQYQSGIRPTATLNTPTGSVDSNHHGFREREKSVSISPKTRVPSLPSMNQMKASGIPMSILPDEWNRPSPVVKRRVEPDTPVFERRSEPKLIRTPSRSVGVNNLLNAEPSFETTERNYRSSKIKSPTNKENESDLQVIDENNASRLYSSPSSSQIFNTTQESPTQPSLTPHRNSIIFESPKPEINPSSQRPTQPDMVSEFKLQAMKTSSSLIDSHLPSAQKASRGSKKNKRKPEQSPQDEVTEIGATPANKKPRLVEPQIDNTHVDASISAGASKGKEILRITDWRDVPIFARSVRGDERTKELFERNLKGKPPGSSIKTQIPHIVPGAVNKASGKSQGDRQSEVTNGIHVPAGQPTPAKNGPLGPWEHNIIDIIPAEELTRIVSDFLFREVVVRKDVGVAPAGGGRGLGAVIEIEAKIGQLIDQNTNDRLQLPVMNECVLNQSNPNMRVTFKSSMTENQHRTLNQFLNDALIKSKGRPNSAPRAKPRIPMDYKHTREVDSFYELSQQGALQLPPSVSDGLQLNPRATKKAKVRITTDERTGEELAKIVKTRVADIDVYNPRSLFDWRISVNIEMDFDIDKKFLVEAASKDGKTADRRKDRVSYKHLAYQIDLTQVVPAEPANKSDKEHELEIELSSAEVRKQGELVLERKPNGYEDLVKGFLDNVRLLARHCTGE